MDTARPATWDVAARQEQGVCTCAPGRRDVTCGLSAHRVAARHAEQDEYERNHNPEEPW